MMSGNQKGFPTGLFAFAMVTLLSCCFSPVSSYFTLPRVSRTSDAIIIDYEGVGYSPFSLGRGYGQFVDPGFVPLPAFNPYALVLQQSAIYNPWAYFGRQAVACGKGPTTFPTARALASERIAGGTAAKKGAWPFMVALRKSFDNSLICAGSLISDSKVLLAAQCLEKLSVYEISGVTVLIGMHKIDFSDVQMTRRISKVVIHSGYNAANYANDIAIITLDMPVILSGSVSTVCLAPGSTDPDLYQDQAAIVLGWEIPAASSGTGTGGTGTGGSGTGTGGSGTGTGGTGTGGTGGTGTGGTGTGGTGTGGTGTGTGGTGTGGSGTGTGGTGTGTAVAFATTLQQALVAIVGSGECRSDSTIGQFSSANTMCVTTGSGAAGAPVIYTCPKDVGGPVVINTAQATAGAKAIYTLVGINSYTRDCASTGLKTRVSAYADWIKTYSA